MEATGLCYSRTEDTITIEAQALHAGQDLVVSISGGTAPHIGSVSLAVPRESLTGDGSRSATVSTLNLTGHKDNEIGDMFARELAKHTGQTCVVTCGIHVDSISKADIDRVISLSRLVLEDLLGAV